MHLTQVLYKIQVLFKHLLYARYLIESKVKPCIAFYSNIILIFDYSIYNYL